MIMMTMYPIRVHMCGLTWVGWRWGGCPMHARRMGVGSMGVCSAGAVAPATLAPTLVERCVERLEAIRAPSDQQRWQGQGTCTVLALRAQRAGSGASHVLEAPGLARLALGSVGPLVSSIAGTIGQQPAPVWRVGVGRTALTCSLGDGGCRCTVLASCT